eukprot:9792136-Alexandrium_andersonii.AAC.1
MSVREVDGVSTCTHRLCLRCGMTSAITLLSHARGQRMHMPADTHACRSLGPLSLGPQRAASM